MRNASIAVSQWSDGAYQFHVSGKVEASTEHFDMKLQRMLGHLPGLMHADPKSVLVVGFGGGITAESDPAAEYQETLDKAAGIFRSFHPRKAQAA